MKIEQIKTDPLIVPQCRRCCGWSHTANYCFKAPRCVKCSGKHFSHLCPFPGRIQNPKCVNCGATGHPASYRGCPFAKEFQLARKNQLKAKESPPQTGKNFPKLNKKDTPTANKPKPLEKSFAQAVSDNRVSDSSNQTDIINTLLKTIESLNTQIQLLNEKISRLEAKK